jgi:hypothetical protein
LKNEDLNKKLAANSFEICSMSSPSSKVIGFVYKIELEISTLPLTLAKFTGGCLMSYGIYNPSILSMIGLGCGTLLVIGTVVVEKVLKRSFDNKFKLYGFGTATVQAIKDFSRKDSSTPNDVTDSITYEPIPDGECYMKCTHNQSHYISIDTIDKMNRVYLKQQGLTDESLENHLASEGTWMTSQVESGKMFLSLCGKFSDKEKIFHPADYLKSIEADFETKFFVKSATVSYGVVCPFCMKPMSLALVK